MRYAIWYHLCNLKILKYTNGALLLLVKLQTLACNFTKSNTPPWVFSRILNCTNGGKSHIASQFFYSQGFQRKFRRSDETQSTLFQHIWHINPFHTTVLFLYPLKTSENQSFSDFFRGNTENEKILDVFREYIEKGTSDMKWVDVIFYR